MKTWLKSAASIAALLSLATLSAADAQAQRRGGGGGGGAAARSSSLRSSASANVNRAGTRDTASRSGSRDARDNRGSGDRNINNSGNRTNINTGDINIDRDVDIDVDVDHGWGCCDNDYNGWGAFYAGAVVGAAVTRAAVVGAYYSTLPTNCVIVTQTTVTYYQCGSVWYQPVYSGMTVQYVVVTAP